LHSNNSYFNKTGLVDEIVFCLDDDGEPIIICSEFYFDTFCLFSNKDFLLDDSDFLLDDKEW